MLTGIVAVTSWDDYLKAKRVGFKPELLSPGRVYCERQYKVFKRNGDYELVFGADFKVFGVRKREDEAEFLVPCDGQLLWVRPSGAWKLTLTVGALAREFVEHSRVQV